MEGERDREREGRREDQSLLTSGACVFLYLKFDYLWPLDNSDVKELIKMNQEVCIRNASTVVSRIYAPRFATLTLVESVGGAYMRDLTFYLTNTPPLPVPRLDVDITLYYIIVRHCLGGFYVI